MQETLCSVYLLDAPFVLDKPFDYYLPDTLAGGEAVPGRLVTVPFGVGNHISYGVIRSVREGECDLGTKPILTFCSPVFSLTEPMWRLAEFLREYTLCSLGEAVRAILPSAALGAVEERYYAKGTTGDEVLSYLAEHPGSTSAELERAFGARALSRLSRLRAEGLVEREDRIPATVAPLMTRYYTLNGAKETFLPLLEEGNKTLRSGGQKALLAALLDSDDWEERELLERVGGTRAQLKALVEKGIFSLREEETYRSPYAAVTHPKKDPIALSRCQMVAYDTLSALYREDAPRAALLYGVTGSGKTKVMMRLLDDVLAEGKTAIVMVPEIGLTPQTVSLFCSRYGRGVAVIHSSLSVGERFDTYRRILAGEVQLVIGTRSAVFAPLRNVGLIVLDEEHEHTYKSDQNPKYHARDVAAFRCGEEKALMLLASATPSVESFYKAKSGRYTLVPLRERYGGAMLPKTEIVDLREELRRGNTSSVSDLLLEALQETVAEGEQAILFCNRRGYNSAVSCRSCGEALTCPNCSVSLTYHTAYTGGYLLCHTCGYKLRPPKVCPACESEQLSYRGFGTQKAEGEILRLLEGASVLRMDADTTTGKASYDRLLEKFRNKGGDVLLGTQMVTKGHDFPDVTLSGVLLADAALHMSDFRAGERTFSLLTQVVGRAGRGKKPGRAIIQTFCPENDVIRLAAEQDYEQFYEGEIALRKSACFPPFCDIVRLVLAGADEPALFAAAQKANEFLQKTARETIPKEPLQIYGPLEMQTYKANGKFRLNFVLKCRVNRSVRQYVARFLREFAAVAGRHIQLSADINPT